MCVHVYVLLYNSAAIVAALFESETIESASIEYYRTVISTKHGFDSLIYTEEQAWNEGTQCTGHGVALFRFFGSVISRETKRSRRVHRECGQGVERLGQDSPVA